MPSAKPAAVGGFVLGALIIVVVAILFFGGPEAFSSKTKALVYFDGSVGGLGPGSPVTFRGVRGFMPHAIDRLRQALSGHRAPRR